MSEETEPAPSKSEESKAGALRCERCGAYAADNYGELTLCADCRADAGSCCSGEFP